MREGEQDGEGGEVARPGEYLCREQASRAHSNLLQNVREVIPALLLDSLGIRRMVRGICFSRSARCSCDQRN